MKYKLNIEIPFIDKITQEVYKVGDVKEFDENRAKELLKDTRKLVSVNAMVEEQKDIESKGDKDKNGNNGVEDNKDSQGDKDKQSKNDVTDNKNKDEKEQTSKK